jgi:hypothetical protein
MVRWMRRTKSLPPGADARDRAPAKLRDYLIGWTTT